MVKQQGDQYTPTVVSPAAVGDVIMFLETRRDSMNVERKVRRFRIVCGFLIVFSMLFCKILVLDGFYSLWDFVYLMRDTSIWEGETASLVVLCFGIFAVIAILLYLIRTIWLIKGKSLKTFEFLPGVGFGFFVVSVIAGGQMYIGLVNIAFVIIDYMGSRWIEERDEMNRKYEEMKARERYEKEEKKRVRYFPGRYPEEFFRMIRKNASYNKKGQMILASGCFLTAAFMYIILTMYGLISQVHGEEDFLFGFGLARIFKQTGFLMALCSILMMTMIIGYYIKDQNKSNSLLVILGMRSRTIYLMFGIVFSANAFISGVAGILFGGAASYIIRDIWQSSLTNNGAVVNLASAISVRTIGLGILGYLVIVLLSLGFNQENVLNLARSMNMNTQVEKEKRGKKYNLILVILGLLLLAVSIRIYFSRSWAETMYIHIFTVLGVYLLIKGGTAICLNRLERHRDRYNRNLIANRPLYYRFQKSTWNLFYLSVLHLFILSMFGVQLAGGLLKQNIPEMFPYSIVCTAYDADMEDLDAIAKKHGAEASVYPMLRITSIYGSDAINKQWGPYLRPVQWPQGQHIAISESTYRALKEALGKTPEKLDLSDDEIHVVYQQDLSAKAHTIDWDTNRIHKMLRIGQPLMSYNTGIYEKIFPERIIKSEERDCLTGTFHQGMEDNLVVFNDQYFEEEYQRISTYNKEQWSLREAADIDEWRAYPSYSRPSNMTEGPTQLICWNVPEKEYEGMLKDMDYLTDKHAFDRDWDSAILPFYGKQQMIVDTGAEIFFRKLVYLFILILMTIMGLFQYYVKFESEARELNWQNNFLRKLGMRQNDRKKALAGQMKIFAVLPLAVGTLGGIIFGGLTVRARLYDSKEVLGFLIAGGIIYLVYVGVWVLWYFWIKRMIWRQAEWEN